MKFIFSGSCHLDIPVIRQRLWLGISHKQLKPLVIGRPLKLVSEHFLRWRLQFICGVGCWHHWKETSLNNYILDYIHYLYWWYYTYSPIILQGRYLLLGLIFFPFFIIYISQFMLVFERSSIYNLLCISHSRATAFRHCLNFSAVFLFTPLSNVQHCFTEKQGSCENKMEVSITYLSF